MGDEQRRYRDDGVDASLRRSSRIRGRFNSRWRSQQDPTQASISLCLRRSRMDHAWRGATCARLGKLANWKHNKPKMATPYSGLVAFALWWFNPATRIGAPPSGSGSPFLRRSAKITPTKMEPDKLKNPRTNPAIEAYVAVGILGTLHLFCLAIGFADNGFVFRGYFTFSCIVLPTLSIVALFILHRLRSWHQGQITLLLLASGIMSFVQFMIVSQATAV